MIKRKLMLVTDLVIMEDICNGNCLYCLTKSSSLKESHVKLQDSGFKTGTLDKIPGYFPGEPLWIRLNRLLDLLEEYVNSPILKVSGGEIFLIPGIMEFLTEASKRYIRLQVLTNGTLLTHEVINNLAEIPNLHLQVSLDGCSLESNWARVRGDKSLHDRIISGLELVLQKGINLEINCVLNKFNTGFLAETVMTLYEKGKRVKFLPYPIRGSQRYGLLPEKEQLEALNKLLDLYEIYSSILPPKPYLERLQAYFRGGARRKEKCNIPHCLFQIFDDGMLAACVNMWTMDIGNVLTGDHKVLETLGHERVHELLTASEPTLYCRSCYTPWDIINLYLEGEIKLFDLMQMPLYEGLESYFKAVFREKREEVSCG